MFFWLVAGRHEVRGTEMDAGLTGLLGGVIGAAVGAMGTTAGAWIAGRKAETQARVQAETQIALARMQHKVDHVQQQRDARRAAYTELLRSSRALNVELRRCARQAIREAQGARLPDGGPGLTWFMESGRELREGATVMGEYWETACVLGPNGVVATSSEVTGAVSCHLGTYGRFVADVLRANRAGEPIQEVPPELEQAHAQVVQACENFLFSVRGVLDLDGVDSA
ncbi:hypothetical protein [Streptomyces sp. NPDC048527]|uniref:hypothetical protein n=1 Tax=Streptomyces sp. NPDC048527 TaxID=3365568 RepID=UPI003724446E